MRAGAVILSVLLLLSASSPPTAAPVSNHGVIINSEIDAKGKKRIIKVVIDEKEMLDSYDYWKGRGLRRETTETFRSHPFSRGAVFAFGSAYAVLHGRARVFEGFPVTVVAAMIEIDDYGHPQPHAIFSFTLTADLNAKIDRDHFNPESFQRIAPHALPSHLAHRPLYLIFAPVTGV